MVHAANFTMGYLIALVVVHANMTIASKLAEKLSNPRGSLVHDANVTTGYLIALVVYANMTIALLITSLDHSYSPSQT